MTLVLALNYSAKWEILEAVKSIGKQIKEQKITPDQIDENIFEIDVEARQVCITESTFVYRVDIIISLQNVAFNFFSDQFSLFIGSNFVDQVFTIDFDSEIGNRSMLLFKQFKFLKCLGGEQRMSA